MLKSSNKGAKDSYTTFRDSGGTLTRGVYAEVCSAFNQMVMDRLIDHAEVFNMGSRLSTLQVVRRPRKHFQYRIDWVASNKRRKEIVEREGSPAGPGNPEGEKWLIYFDMSDDEFYVAFYWKKIKVNIPNKTVYRFDATRGVKGNKQRLANHIQESPYAIFEYPTN